MPERLLLFSAAGERFALGLPEVSEVMEPQPYFPVPRAPSHFLGLFNFHGTLTALLDLGRYLGAPPGRGAGKVLVLHGPGAQLALSVEGVRAIIPRQAVLAETPGSEPLTSARLETEEGSFRLIELHTLLEVLEQEL
jgi:purine-binding chemotaxis protein CheW